MTLISSLINYIAPVFLILSPITSYADQILSIHRTRTSAGFSLDIPLIMLTASILKLFYWPGAHYDLALLVQAFIMVGIQSILLKVALDNRPSWRNEGRPFKSLDGETLLPPSTGRPYGFWRWRQQRPYWEYLGVLTLTLLALHTYFQPKPKEESLYTHMIGYTGLTIEAFLPIPQILANGRAKSCKGFRVSVLANWLMGDAMKIGFFFLSEPGKVPWAFKMCGMFQACCDVGLGAQYYIYEDGERITSLAGKELEEKIREERRGIDG